MSRNIENNQTAPRELDLTDQDVYEAMKAIPGYLDITPGDFKELYRHAYRHAVERLSRSLKVRDIMTSDVVCVRRETPLHEVAAIMSRRGISGVPVLDAGGKVLGVISETDFLARMGATGRKNFMSVVADCLKAKGCDFLPAPDQRAEDIMSSPAITVTEQMTYLEIARLFMEKAINRAPVVDQEGHLLGIVSRADILEATRCLSCRMPTQQD
jgi:CBS domain-containing membrane protein